MMNAKQTKVARQYLADLAYELFEGAKRYGSEEDEPEGARWIQISDTLARKTAMRLQRISAAMDPDPAMFGQAPVPSQVMAEGAGR